jgi:hypothetical protein
MTRPSSKSETKVDAIISLSTQSPQLTVVECNSERLRVNLSNVQYLPALNVRGDSTMPPLLSLLMITEKGDVTTAYSHSREHGQPNANDQLANTTGPGQKG